MPRPNPQGKDGTLADASTVNIIDRFAPKAALPYLKLARFDRPIGIFLLAFPCFWSVSLAARSIGDAYPDPILLLLFLIGAIVMRGAGCTYNDVVDRDIDAQVARTRTRPLPSGKVTPKAAFVFMVALCLVGLAVLLSFNRFTILLGLGVLPIVALYPFVKRISHWPQAVLGLAFNWGALMGWAPVHGRLDLAPLVLYAGAVCWTIGYDTIYAHQDREDDGLLGVRSTALRFGRATKPWLMLLLFARLARNHYCGTSGRLRFCVPHRHGSRGRDTELGFERLHELRELEHADALDVIDHLLLRHFGHCYLLLHLSPPALGLGAGLWALIWFSGYGLLAPAASTSP
jgi:4-hydroxybenzoate polyprenyltransferase